MHLYSSAASICSYVFMHLALYSLIGFILFYTVFGPPRPGRERAGVISLICFYRSAVAALPGKVDSIPLSMNL